MKITKSVNGLWTLDLGNNVRFLFTSKKALFEQVMELYFEPSPFHA